MNILYRMNTQKIISALLGKPMYILPLFIMLFTGSCKKDQTTPEIKKVNMQSDFGSDFELQIALPEDYDPSKTYGLIFLLDAEWLMKETLAALKKTSYASGYIVAGLAYSGTNNRTNDFTPTTSKSGTGKASHLANFIETKVFGEYIKQHYPNLSSDKQKHVFIGYSLGGLFGTYLFLKQTPLFAHYLFISSSYMTDAQSVFGIELEERSVASRQRAKMYFATGSLEENGFHSTVQHFTQILSQHYTRVTYKNESINNVNHTGVRVKALEQGLPYLLKP